MHGLSNGMNTSDLEGG